MLLDIIQTLSSPQTDRLDIFFIQYQARDVIISLQFRHSCISTVCGYSLLSTKIPPNVILHQGVFFDRPFWSFLWFPYERGYDCSIFPLCGGSYSVFLIFLICCGEFPVAFFMKLLNEEVSLYPMISAICAMFLSVLHKKLVAISTRISFILSR